jgi:fructokinase
MRIGVDLGGTKIEIVALDASGAQLLRRRVATPAGSYDGTLDTVAALVRAVEAETGMRGSVGIGHPGVVSPQTGLVKNANSTILIGKPLERDLHARLQRPLRLANDANCFALSEAVDGAGAGARCVFGVILGTGVGGGIVVRGEPLVGANAIAGEWGHNPLPWPQAGEAPGPACYCGKRGCLETFLSGPGLARDYAAARSAAPGVSARAEVPAHDIAAAAAAGEPTARAALERYTSRLARGLASVIDVLDPDVVVLGGGLSNLAGLPHAVSAALPAFVFSDTLATQVVRAAHGDSSGVRGAAWLWPRDEAR